MVSAVEERRARCAAPVDTCCAIASGAIVSRRAETSGCRRCCGREPQLTECAVILPSTAAPVGYVCIWRYSSNAPTTQQAPGEVLVELPASGLLLTGQSAALYAS